MTEDISVKNTGLRGVTVADTKVSFIDGEKGVLIYRGYRIEDLAEFSTFEETAYLILKGVLPSSSELDSFKYRLASNSSLPEHVTESMNLWPKDSEPMQILMAVISMLGCDDHDPHNNSPEVFEEKAVRLLSAMAVALTAWERIRQGLDPVSYSEGLSHAENILFMMQGERPDPEIARALDVCLILHADHTFNASTFACREVASTQAGIYPAVLAGLAALSGPLHGGANEKAMAMIEALRNEDDIESWIQKQIAGKKKIYGMGHAVYKTYDPRAAILKDIFTKIGEKMGDSEWFTLCEKVENAAIKVLTAAGKDRIKPNIDFYSGSVYHAMGFPHNLFTPLFAVSRISGWCAHIIEERFGLAQSKPSLYRPAAEYIGNYCGLMGCDYNQKNE
ncbi:citrate (Si)-synthase [bacterium]|nr:MAG: citrate (Si)-synthase [bacterium]